jgi:hypothetical protein
MYMINTTHQHLVERILAMTDVTWVNGVIDNLSGAHIEDVKQAYSNRLDLFEEAFNALRKKGDIISLTCDCCGDEYLFLTDRELYSSFHFNERNQYNFSMN